MNPRDRLLNAVRRKPVDRIPKDAWFTQEIKKKVEEKTGSKDPDEYFGLESRIVTRSPFIFNPKFDEYFKILKKEDTRVKIIGLPWWGEEKDEKVQGKKNINEWGVAFDYGNFYHFSKMKHTMAALETIEDLKKWPWPILRDEDYFDNLKIIVKEYKKKNIATIAYYGCVFEQAWYLRGMEKLFIDFYFNKKFADYLLNKIAELNTMAAIKLISCGVDIIRTGDDVSTQQDLMMSIDMWRKWIKPYTKTTLDEIKKVRSDILIKYHSDGNNYKIIPDLIEIGCDILHPIQPECMDPINVYKEYGKEVSFWGTIGTQQLLPFGTPFEIKIEVTKMIDAFDAFNGGLVIAPTHWIEPDVPWENIIAFFEAVEEVSDV